MSRRASENTPQTSAALSAALSDFYGARRSVSRTPWRPSGAFSANRQFKTEPRLLASASGMYYRTVDGRDVLDATGGLWCCNAGHTGRASSRRLKNRSKPWISPHFQMGHPLPFALAERLAEIAHHDQTICSSPTQARVDGGSPR